MDLNFLKKDDNNFIKPTTTVYRKQIINGFSIPAFIKNDTHHFVDLDVYEDGRVECWNFQDFEHFKNDVKRGWIQLSVPDNNEISIHGLGSWIINDGNWLFNKDTFINYVQSLIKVLNPKLENIYKYSEKVINGIINGEDGSGTIYKELKEYPDDNFPEKLIGESLDIFYKVSDKFFLVKVNVFEDSSIQLSRLERPIDLTLSEFEKLIHEKSILTEVPDTTTIYIHGLGNFKIATTQYVTTVQDKLLEIKDKLRELNGQPSSIDICREAYQNYIDNPTVENKEKLKISYENVPKHERRYIGDMDTKDVEVRMIIYGEQEIENWSHYRAAKSLGQPLPQIKIIKPKDEKNNG